MAGIAEVKSLTARKQALVAESELYRQALGIEIDHLKLASVRIKRNVGFLRLLKPILLLAPLAGSLIGRRSPKPETPALTGWRKWWGAALLGWRLYRRAAPVMAHFISQRNSRTRPRQRRGQFTP